jgi:hypothetical protein
VGVLELLELADGEGGEVDVDAADFAAAALDLVNGVDGLEYIVEALGPGIGLPGDQENALMAHFDEDFGLLGDFGLGEDAAFELGVGGAEGAVGALVLAEVRDVERGEQHEAVAIDLLLDETRGGEDLFQQVGFASFHEHGDLRGIEAVEEAGFGQDLADAGRTGPAGFGEGFLDFGLVNERGLFIARFAGSNCHTLSFNFSVISALAAAVVHHWILLPSTVTVGPWSHFSKQNEAETSTNSWRFSFWT